MTIRRRRCGREVALAVFGLVAFLAVSCGDTPPERATGERLSPPPASASPSPRLAGSKDPGSFPKRPDASFDLAESARGWQLLDRAKWMRGRGVLMTVGPRLEVVRAVSPIRVHPGSPVMIEAEVVLPNSKGSGAGVWCRADRAFKSGYAFVIGRDGGWGLFRYDDGVPTQLERGAVYPGELRGREPTLIRLACGATTDRGMVFAIAFNDKPFALIAEHARPLSRRIGRVGVTASRVPAGGQPARALLTHFSARLGSGE